MARTVLLLPSLSSANRSEEFHTTWPGSSMRSVLRTTVRPALPQVQRSKRYIKCIITRCLICDYIHSGGGSKNFMKKSNIEYVKRIADIHCWGVQKKFRKNRTLNMWNALEIFTAGWFKKFHEKSKRWLCETHWSIYIAFLMIDLKLLSSRKSFVQVINKGGITYRNAPFHRDCFTCMNCNRLLAAEKFTSKDEKPFCADCFGELFARKCIQCTKPISGQ